MNLRVVTFTTRTKHMALRLPFDSKSKNRRHIQTNAKRIQTVTSCHLAVSFFPGVMGDERGVDRPAGATFMLTMKSPIPKSGAPAP